MNKLSSLRNIGEELEKKLEAVGIETVEMLEEVGSKGAFVRIKSYYPNVCLVHLMALEGAISDIEYNHLPDDVQRDLKEFSNNFK